MSELRDKTISGMFWSFLDNFAVLGIQFIAGIILARILSPAEFGLVGMLAIFIAISQTFVDSGLSQALIRKKAATESDYTTAFVFNIFVGVLLYLMLYFSADLIVEFFHEPRLKPMVRVLGLSVIVNSFQVIQRAILIKRINFKLQMRISILAAVSSGVVSIAMAYSGYGVWSLVVKVLMSASVSTILLWVFNAWRPSESASLASFKELFAFGSRLLASSLIGKVYDNIYLLIIGRYFSAAELGYYTQAFQFQRLPSQNLTMVIQRVSFPVLADLQDDKIKLLINYKRLIRTSFMLTSILMLGMAAVARPMILVLLGEKWLQSVVYLQLLCFGAIFYPLHALNLNMLNVKGRSDLFLRLEILKKLMAIPIIFIGIKYGIPQMIIGLSFSSMIGYILNSWWSGKLIGYSTLQQIKDILPYLGVALTSSFLALSVSIIPFSSLWMLLVTQLTVGITVSISILEMFNLIAYIELKQIIHEKLVNVRRKK